MNCMYLAKGFRHLLSLNVDYQLLALHFCFIFSKIFTQTKALRKFLECLFILTIHQFPSIHHGLSCYLHRAAR